MRFPLKIKMAMTLFVIIVGAIIGNWFINMIFQEKFYTATKENDLVSLYSLMNESLIEGKNVPENVRREIVSLCENKSLTVLVMDQGLTVKLYSGYSIMDDSLADRFNRILFNRDEIDGETIRSEKNFIMSKIYDSESSHDYLEMYGTLDSGDMFIMRTSVDSMRLALKVTNQFIIYTGGLVITISLVCVLLFSMGLTARIEKLAYISTEMSNLNFNIKYHDDGQDEISMLGKNMNVLSEKLENTISELKTANIELQRDIQKKEEIDAMRKEFLSNVSHELKTPIAIIQGYAEGLKEIADEPESRDYYCEVIADEAVKMNRMVGKLLTLNQIEFGNTPVEMERFDLIELIDRILNRTEVLLEEKKANVIFDNKNHVEIWADAFLVEEVVTNYISNAINHLDGERVIKIDVKDMGNVIRCSVFNTGKPIPEEDIDKIWDKFYKVDKARTREYGGSGIGLSIVKAVMSSMHRDCGVKNADNGVEFWFETEKCI